jgi:hypothetical protein
MVELRYTGQTELNSQNNKYYEILDSQSVDFTGAEYYEKIGRAHVSRALGGETFTNETGDPSVANAGDAIFTTVKLEDGKFVPVKDATGKIDTFLPPGQKFDELDKKYEILQTNEDGGVIVRTKGNFKMLPGVVTQPTCLIEPWGKGYGNQFLEPGATLKLEPQGVTGINPHGFDGIWVPVGAKTAALQQTTQASDNKKSPKLS